VPIFTDAHCFAHYRPRAIEGSLAQALRGIGKHGGRSTARLECYMQLTRQTLATDELNTKEGIEKLRGFIGAVFSERFETSTNSHRSTVACYLREALKRAGASEALAAIARLTPDRGNPDLQSLVAAFTAADLDEDRVLFWRGWCAQTRLGKAVHYELHGAYEKLGSSFVGRFFEALSEWQQGQVKGLPLVNSFSEYLASTPPFVVNNAKQVSVVVKAFIVKTIETAHKDGGRIESAIQHARTFLRFLERHVFTRIWSAPLPRVPMPASIRISGAKTHVRKTAQGHEVKRSLITEIPLEVKDSDAIETLLGAIQKDVDLIVGWARTELEQARQRVKERKELAATGIVGRLGETNVRSGICYRRSKRCPERLNHAAATYEAIGFSHLKDRRVKISSRIYPQPLQDVTWRLGVPSKALLLAPAAILVAAHPAITSSFLESLELIDKNGAVVGFVEIDGGHYLVGEKRRRGAELADQKILLNAETAAVVRTVIELTTPLREFLRDIGDDNWRRLFIYSNSLGTKPNAWNPAGTACYSKNWLATRLESLVSLECVSAQDLASRFSLARLRDSAAVIVYLKTGSVQRMAEALGHRRWQPSLLDHYLPRPIQQFFVDRWIRLFQAGIVCEAMKDSPLLLRASHFETMQQLDEFLKAHMLRRIPLHLEDPDSPFAAQAESSTERIVFGVESGILTILMSLELAVDSAVRVPCARAIRWARISRHLIPYMEAQREQPEFRDMVRVARQYANASEVAGLIYE
jgi:hypothetical protein